MITSIPPNNSTHPVRWGMVDANLTQLVVIQPSTFCNLGCRYCYVSDRDKRWIMDMAVLEEILTKVFSSDTVADNFRLVWHNCEPLSLGYDFFHSAYSLIDRVNSTSKAHRSAIQTNGTLLTDDWMELFALHNILPSISIDGPKAIHDANRVNKAGHGSFDAVMRGIDILRKHKAPVVGLSCVTEASLDHGSEWMQFFIDEGFSSVGFIIEEPWGGSPNTSLTLGAELHTPGGLESKYIEFLNEVWDVWEPHRESITVREFANMASAFHKLKLNPNSYSQQEDAMPCKVLSFDWRGKIATFSPQMIAGTPDDPDKFAVANIRDISDLRELRMVSKHLELSATIKSGISLCRNECGYFCVCGGGTPASKFYEHGTFECTETRECRYSKQLLCDILLKKLSTPRDQDGDVDESSVCPTPMIITSRGLAVEAPPAGRRSLRRIYSKVLEGKTLVWDVEGLWRLAAHLTPEMVDIESIAEIDSICWFSKTRPPTLRSVAMHAKRVFAADVSLPIILGAENELMDGAHRVARALLEGQQYILALKFSCTPVPDFIEDIFV